MVRNGSGRSKAAGHGNRRLCSQLTRQHTPYFLPHPYALPLPAGYHLVFIWPLTSDMGCSYRAWAASALITIPTLRAWALAHFILAQLLSHTTPQLPPAATPLPLFGLLAQPAIAHGS